MLESDGKESVRLIAMKWLDTDEGKAFLMGEYDRGWQDGWGERDENSFNDIDDGYNVGYDSGYHDGYQDWVIVNGGLPPPLDTGRDAIVAIEDEAADGWRLECLDAQNRLAAVEAERDRLRRVLNRIEAVYSYPAEDPGTSLRAEFGIGDEP
jgi:hypothetical protein